MEPIFNYRNNTVKYSPDGESFPFVRVSYSSKSSLQQCPSRYYWGNERQLAPVVGSTAMRFGSVFHALLDSFYNSIKENGWKYREQAIVEALKIFNHDPENDIIGIWEEATGDQIYHEDHRTKENVINLFLQYVDHWIEDMANFEILDTELYYRIEIKLTDQELDLFPYLQDVKFFITGIRDLRLRENGHLWVYEHKTTGSWINTIKKTLFRSPQIINYNWTEDLLSPDDPIEGVMVNIAHFSQYKKKDGGYGAVKVEFDRSPQIFTKKDIAAHRLRTLEAGNEIMMRREKKLWTQEMDSCFLFNSSCEYLELCEQHRDLEETNTNNYVQRPERNKPIVDKV